MNKPTLTQYSVVVRNEPATLAQVTQLLAQEGANIECLFVAGFGDVTAFRFLLNKEDGVRRKLEKAGFPVLDNQVFCLEMANRPGELHKLCFLLAAEDINIQYLYGTSHGEAAKLILCVDDAEKAARIIEGAEAELLASAV